MRERIRARGADAAARPSRSGAARVARLLARVVLAAGVAGCGGKPAPPPEDLLAVELRGISYLERYDEADQAKAIETLRSVVERAPAWREARINYALSLAVGNAADKASLALAEYEKVLADDPWNPYALFQSALVHRFQGRSEAAIPLLERVAAIDPEDASVHYWLGMLEAEGDGEREEVAEAHLRKAVALGKNDASAVYALFLTLSRQGKGDTPEAQALRERFHGLEEAERFGSKALAKHLKRGQNEYGEAGKYALAIRDLAPPAGTAFFDATAKAGLARAAPPAGAGGDAPAPGIACGDVDDDGDDDLVIVSPAGATLWRNDAGAFADATKGSGLEGVTGVAALFGDVDDDGRVDLAVAGERLRLFHALGGGRFEEVSAERLGPAAARRCVALAFADLDHDGDLDLLAAGESSAWLRNKRDGTFDDATAERGVGGDAAEVAVFDEDGDTISDLLWFSAKGPLRMLRNGRLEAFAADPAFDALGPAVAGCVGDADGDGLLDVVLVRADGRVALARGSASGRWSLDPTFPALSFGATSAAVADFDGDGRPDVLLAGSRVSLLRGLPRGGFRVESLPLPEASRGPMAVSDFDGDGALDVVLTAKGAAPTLLRGTTTRARHALRLRLRGVADRVSGRTWSNARGIGADVEAKAGDLVLRQPVLAGTGSPGQTSDRLVLGLGERTKADFVRVRWTDGVLQSEFEVPADRPHAIEEVNRKLASCPVLFAWTGSRFEYVTDTLGAGGLGFYLGPTLGYGPPDPTEVLTLPRLAPRGGRYAVSLVENLEEVSYLDEARLLVVDHDPSLVVHPDERFASDPPLPADRFFAAREPIAPVSATDDEGRDVLEKVLVEDRDVVDSFRRDPRFVGFADDHALTLDFGERVARVGGSERLVLFLAGWVEYGYSKTCYAAAQAGIEMRAPALEVEDGRGAWKRAAGLGYPAGNSRTMTYDVTGILGHGVSRARIRTNLEVYWDRIHVAIDAADGALRVASAPCVAADLHARGYPREYSPDGRAPTLYDLSACEAWIPFRTQAGDYTRFGDVAPLVARADDRFAIFGKGEEVTLEFAADAFPPPPAGLVRSYFLRLDGYCKDRDPYTAVGDTVEPLPFHAMSTYPYPKSERYPDDALHREYRATWNVRRVR